MWWILILLLQGIVLVSGIRDEQRAGCGVGPSSPSHPALARWNASSSSPPLLYINLRSRYFIPVYVTACIVAALNFIWMIIVARRWKLPDGRTRLQAYRDYQREFQGGK